MAAERSGPSGLGFRRELLRDLRPDLKDPAGERRRDAARRVAQVVRDSNDGGQTRDDSACERVAHELRVALAARALTQRNLPPAGASRTLCPLISSTSP